MGWGWALISSFHSKDMEGEKKVLILTSPQLNWERDDDKVNLVK